MNRIQLAQLVLVDIAKRPLTIEKRPRGYYIMHGNQTMFGFDTLALLEDYLVNAKERGRLYIPAAHETYR